LQLYQIALWAMDNSNNRTRRYSLYIKIHINNIIYTFDFTGKLAFRCITNNTCINTMMGKKRVNISYVISNIIMVHTWLQTIVLRDNLENAMVRHNNNGLLHWCKNWWHTSMENLFLILNPVEATKREVFLDTLEVESNFFHYRNNSFFSTMRMISTLANWIPTQQIWPHYNENLKKTYWRQSCQKVTAIRLGIQIISWRSNCCRPDNQSR
jgi:hypothetical protein